MDKSIGDTDSVSSEDSFSVLSQLTAKLDLPVKLTRENSRQTLPLWNLPQARLKVSSGFLQSFLN